MTKIQAVCPKCDTPRSLVPEEIHLFVSDPDFELSGEFSFFCYKHKGLATRPADERMIGLLKERGVEVQYERIPEYMHPENPPSGPPLSDDDFLDLKLLLEESNWFAELSRQTSRV